MRASRAVLLVLLASIVFHDAATAVAIHPQGTSCNFVLGRSRTAPPQPKHSTCHSTVKCLIGELGWPTHVAEWFIAYLTAVNDVCTSFSGQQLADMAQCDEVPFCRALLPDADGHPLLETQYEKVVETVLGWYPVVAGKPPKFECRPDWFSVLMQPCDGSPAAQMQHCLQDTAGSKACPTGCSSLSLIFEKGYCNIAECWPAWVLKQLCNGTVQDFLNTTRLAWCTDEWCPDSCHGRTVANCSAGAEPCVHEVCAVAAQYVRSFGWTGFRGQCKHTNAVGQLFDSAPSMLAGQGCSVLNWVDSNTTDLGVLMGKVCQTTYPRPASLLPLLHGSDGVVKLWLDAAASNASTLHRGYYAPQETLLSRARRSPLCYATSQQAALIQCPGGYRALDRVLSKPWLSPQLLAAVLPPDSAWRVKLLQGTHVCSGAASTSDVCLDWQVGELNGNNAQPAPWFVPNTSLSVLQAYCQRSFAPDLTSSPVAPVNVTPTCNKVSVDTDRIRQQQAAQRRALAVIWYSYVLLLLLGFLALELYWRLPCRRTRARSSRCTQLSKIVARAWHTLCPTAPDYHAGAPHASPVSQAPGGGWRVWRFSNLTRAAQALAYCADVGLDVWTLVEIMKNTESLAKLASEYPSASAYSTQLSWRSGHSNMLFWWLVIVFIVQYAAGILLTLPPTLAAYGIFDYQRLQFSWGCCSLVFCTGAIWVFLGLFFFVGAWYIVIADVYMLLAMVGVPAKLLQGNRLNLPAYTTVRYLCEGIIEALPSALISTAAINQQLLSQETNKMQLAVFWMSLLFSMLRIARELYKLAQLTHDLDACCFSTAILDMIYHVQPQQGVGAPAQSKPAGNVAGNHGPCITCCEQAPASIAGTFVTAPLSDTGMTRDKTEITPTCGLTGAVSSAGVSPSPQQTNLPACEAAADADTFNVTWGAEGKGGLVPGSTITSETQGCGCCWRCQSCTEYPTVLAVYVYCWLGALIVYLLLVCSDIAYPWLTAARFGNIEGASKWGLLLPPFRKQYNLLMMITSVPGLSDVSKDCVLPSLTCI